jgi:hypothetical protein
VWDIQSREFIHQSLSVACLQAAYKAGVQFPSLNVQILVPQEVLKRQMNESGSLACYPESFLPRKDYETSKKIKTKDRNRRVGGWKEAKKGYQEKNDDDTMIMRTTYPKKVLDLI